MAPIDRLVRRLDAREYCTSPGAGVDPWWLATVFGVVVAPMNGRHRLRGIDWYELRRLVGYKFPWRVDWYCGGTMMGPVVMAVDALDDYCEIVEYERGSLVFHRNIVQ